jgi:hypothetical protein
MGPRNGLEDVERREILPLPGLELEPLGRPARSQSLYRLGPFRKVRKLMQQIGRLLGGFSTCVIQDLETKISTSVYWK